MTKLDQAIAEAEAIRAELYRDDFDDASEARLALGRLEKLLQEMKDEENG